MAKTEIPNVEINENASLANVIGTAIQLPGVKVNRKAFLCEQFKGLGMDELKVILDEGPVAAGRPREELMKKATRLINDRTLKSGGMSFAAGLPGGLAMAATIPADMVQFYGVALRMAQELAYLYGEGDLWSDGMLDNEKVTNQLMLYCGVMLGATGAASTVRVLSSALAKQAIKKLPQQALTKTFYYPIIKSIAKFFGAKMTKDIFAKGVSKAVPLIGGVVSGGLTLATMKPMGKRLADTLDEAHFDYTQEEFEADWCDIVEVVEAEEAEASAAEEMPAAAVCGSAQATTPVTEKPDAGDVMEKIAKAKAMLDAGIITEEEFAAIKARLISEL